MAAVFNASGHSLSCAIKPPGGRKPKGVNFFILPFVLFLRGSALLTLKRLDSIMKLDQKSKKKKNQMLNAQCVISGAALA